MPKRSGGKAKPRKVYPVSLMVIHNQALANKARDIKIAESIKTRMTEEETLTQIQIKDLEKRRKELMK